MITAKITWNDVNVGCPGAEHDVQISGLGDGSTVYLRAVDCAIQGNTVTVRMDGSLVAVFSVDDVINEAEAEE